MRLEMVIVDDNKDDGNAVRQLAESWAKLNHHMVNIRYYDDPIMFINSVYTYCDILILDVMLGEKDGFEIVHKLKGASPDMLIILTSSNHDYAVSGYEVSAFGFLPKPVNPMLLAATLDRAARHTATLSDVSYVIETDGQTRVMPYKEILYFESYGNYVKIYITSGDYVLDRKSISTLLLNMPQFCVRARRNIIVNMMNVESFTRDEVFFKGGKGSIKISKDLHEAMRKAFVQLHRV